MPPRGTMARGSARARIALLVLAVLVAHLSPILLARTAPCGACSGACCKAPSRHTSRACSLLPDCCGGPLQETLGPASSHLEGILPLRVLAASPGALSGILKLAADALPPAVGDGPLVPPPEISPST